MCGALMAHTISELQILSYTAHCKNQQAFIIVEMGALSPKFNIGEIG